MKPRYGQGISLQLTNEQLLKRPVHYHLSRHSSATHFATKLNRQELCYRYGRKFSSNMPDVYVSRAGLHSKAADEKFQHTELVALKGELAQVEQSDKIFEIAISMLFRKTATV